MNVYNESFTTNMDDKEWKDRQAMFDEIGGKRKRKPLKHRSLFADWVAPVFDGPPPKVRAPLPNLNTENAGE